MQFGEYVYARFKNAGQTAGTGETTGTNYGSDPDHPTLPEYLLAGETTGHDITAADADPANYNYSMDPAQFYQITKANHAGTNWFDAIRSEEHTSELQSLMRISYAVFCLKKKKKK